ncbi:MAG: FAD-binding protein, partial [Bacteroidota bacterium]
MHFTSKGKEERTYDAIVVGTGIAGGWAAMELCKKGLKTLVLERGRMLRHGDYPTANMDSWEFPYRGNLSEESRKRDYPKLSRKDYVAKAPHVHFFCVRIFWILIKKMNV